VRTGNTPSDQEKGPAVLGHTFRRGLTATLVFDVFSKGMGAASLILLIRALSVRDYAFYTVFITTGQLLGSAVASGIRVRYLREEAERSSRGSMRSSQAFLIALTKSLVLIIGCGALGALLLSLLRVSVAGSTGAILVVVATVYAAGIATTELVIAHNEAQRRFVAAGLTSLARAGVILTVSVIVWITPHGGPYRPTILLASAVSILAAVACARILSQERGARPTFSHLWTFNSEERWLSLYYLVAAGFAYVDTIVAAAMLSTRQIAALGVALRYLALALGAIPALNAVLRVRTSQPDLVDSPLAQRVMLSTWIRNAALPVSFLFVAALVVIPFALPVIDGGKFTGAVVPLQIYMSTAFAIYLTLPASNLLMARRRFRWLAMAQLTALLANLVGDVAVASPFGIVGIATVSSSAFVALEIATVRTGLAAPTPPAPLMSQRLRKRISARW
jgi:O-antigen/teichoic acid export membrane protein